MLGLIFGCLFGGLFLILAICVMILPSMLWRAFVMSKMWLWFMVPIFHVIPISWIVCIGLAAFIGMFSTQVDMKKIRETIENNKKLSTSELLKIFGEGLWIAFLTPATVLLVGWLTKGYIAQ